MTDESHHWGASDTAPYGGGPDPAVAAGWYPDPWSHGQHRYWDGSGWTSGTFPNGPATDGADSAELAYGSHPTAAPVVGVASPPDAVPPPGWTPPTYRVRDATPPAFGAAPPPPTTELASDKPSRLPTGLAFVALVAAVVLVFGALGTLGGYLAFGHKKSTPAATGVVPTLPPPFSIPGPTPSTRPADPAASSLSSLVITQSDVASTIVVQTDSGGGQVSPENGTLDLCNGTFGSESRRTARLQVSAYDGVGNSLLSTEAVLYQNPAAANQAFSELKSVAASCPPSPVVSPIGEPTATTHFNTPPDSSWAPTPTVSRLAYDFTSADATGSSHSVAVYLHRGRALVGVYFHTPDAPQITVAGQSTIEKITGVFAARLAQLPDSVVNG